jgi:hypothetical protein
MPSMDEQTPKLAVVNQCLVASIALAVMVSALMTSVRASTTTSDALVATGAVQLAAQFELAVSPRLDLPAAEALAYALRLQGALDAFQLSLAEEKFVVLIDRSPSVQAALLFLGSAIRGWTLIGATPVSTGLPGRYEHFLTPLGVFDHSMANPDFRAEGTKNKLGFRGYGRKGMRIYDFGWVNSRRGWGKGGMGVLRLQMHATDPELAEQKLGSAQSEGCVRIPASLNEFMDPPVPI